MTTPAVLVLAAAETQAWHDVADVHFVQPTGHGEHTEPFLKNPSLQAQLPISVPPRISVAFPTQI